MNSVQTKNVEAIAARARISVQRELSRVFGDVDLDSLVAVVNKIDDLLILSLEDVFQKHPEILAPGCSFIPSSHLFVLDREHFMLKMSQDVLEPHILHIALLSIERQASGKDSYITETVTLTDSCQFRRAQINVPRGTNLTPSSIALLTEGVYSTGYRWLEETVKDVSSREIAGAGHDLYRMIRELLPDASVADEVWLVAFARDEGSYLLDRGPTDKAIAKLSGSMTGASASPLSLVAKLFTTILMEAEAHARFAIQSMTCIDVSLNESKYSDDKTLFLEAEKVIFGSPDISIFPIYAADHGRVVAVFSKRHRAMLEPFLEAHAKELTERFLLSRNRFRRLFKALHHQWSILPPGKAGEFVGGVVKSIFMEP